MDEFRPVLTGLASLMTPAIPAVSTYQEPDPMGITSDNADRIHELIVANGGSLSAAQLREDVSDLDPTARRVAIKYLREQGRIESIGSTSLIIYHLPGEAPASGVVTSTPPAVAAPQHPPRGAQAPAQVAVASVADRVTEAHPAPMKPNTTQLGDASPEVQLIIQLDLVGSQFAADHPGQMDALRRAVAWFACRFVGEGALAKCRCAQAMAGE